MQNEQTGVKTFDDELLSDVKKKRNFASSEWRNEELSPFNNYFQNDEGVDKMIHRSESVVDVFADQKSAVLKKFDDVKFKIL